jgi:hypothetical protein
MLKPNSSWVSRYLLWVLTGVLLMSSPLARAAQASIDRPFTGAADIVVSTLKSSGITIKERADTDRFVILYAERETQQSVAITLFALPQQSDRMTVTINSASPADEHFDNQLLQSIRAQLLEP